jgi:hypothetical protein
MYNRKTKNKQGKKNTNSYDLISISLKKKKYLKTYVERANYAPVKTDPE